MEKLKQNKPLLAAAFFLILAVAYIFGANNIRIYRGAGSSTIGSAFYPRILGYLLLLLSLVEIVKAIASIRSKKVNEDGEKESMSLVAILLTIALTAGYIFLLEAIGFLLMTAVYLFLLIIVLSPKDQRNFKTATIISISTSLIVYFLFVKGFSLLLPRGIIG